MAGSILKAFQVVQPGEKEGEGELLLWESNEANTWYTIRDVMGDGDSLAVISAWMFPELR